MLSPEAERVKAFCKRVVDSENTYQQYWENQKGAKEFEGERSSDIIELLDLLAEKNGEQVDLVEAIRIEKLPYCQMMARSRWQVHELIMAAHLPPLQQRVMIYRYHKAWTWSHIRAMIKYKYVRSVYRLHNQALENMVPTMQAMYPDWKIGDE